MAAITESKKKKTSWIKCLPALNKKSINELKKICIALHEGFLKPTA